MQSNFLSKIGLGNLDLGIVVLVLLIMVIVLAVMVFMISKNNKRITRKYERFMQGERAMSLEDQIQNLIATVDQLCYESDVHAEDINNLYKKHEFAFQKMGLIKYDAYSQMGGKLSFALTILDENNNGFLMNSVHSSTGCYSYTKRIKQGLCDIDLSPEEKASLDKAINSQYLIF